MVLVRSEATRMVEEDWRMAQVVARSATGQVVAWVASQMEEQMMLSIEEAVETNDHNEHKILLVKDSSVHKQGKEAIVAA